MGSRDEPDLSGAHGIYDDPMIDPPDSPASDSEGEMAEDGDEDEGDESLVQGDDEPNEFDEPPPVAGPSRPSGSGSKGLYAPPTVDELDRLHAAHDAGNTFTLQLEALLASTLLPQAPHPALKALLSRIHDLILSLPPLPGVSPKQAVKRTGEIPFPGGAEWSPLIGEREVKWTLGWEAPGEVVVGGSWGVCGGYKKGKGAMGGVDLAVVMPQVRCPSVALDPYARHSP